MFKFTVHKSRWLRGEGADESCLYRVPDAKMCCLGFYCLAKGIQEDNLYGRAAPQNIMDVLARSKVKELMDYSLLMPSAVCNDIMKTNDDEELTDAERIADLKILFAKLGVEMEVVE